MRTCRLYSVTCCRRSAKARWIWSFRILRTFLRANAKAVFAEGITSPKYILTNLFRTSRTFKQIFWSAPHETVSYRISFSSVRTPGMTAQMDPYAPSRYYRSVIGHLAVTAAPWRG